MHSSLSPRVTIAIPTFNRPELLRQTISSLLLYAESSEILVINDGGEIPANLPNHVKLVNFDRNFGEAYAVNVAWALCENEYFVVVSDDDPQADNWLHLLIRAAQAQPKYVAYFPSTYVVNDKGVNLNQFASQYDKKTFHKLLRSPCLAGVLINAKLLKENNVRSLRINGLTYPNDLIQWLELSLIGDFLAVPEAKSLWWEHQDQTSNTIFDVDQADLYFNNVSNWILKNTNDDIKCESLIACCLRSIQLLKRENRTVRSILGFLFRLRVILEKQGYPFLSVLSSALKVILNLLKLKIKNA